MKLKVKLARKYVKDRFGEHHGHEVICYLIGFEKAKEMAVELTKKPAWIVIRDMPKLGEEEVE